MEFPIFINKRIFWDADLAGIDMQLHKNFIITKVFEWGFLKELQALLKYYSKEEIVTALTKQKYLSKKTHQFAAAILDIPKEQFRCYTQRQLHPNAWPV
jgi:hypothetical protein